MSKFTVPSALADLLRSSSGALLPFRHKERVYLPLEVDKMGDNAEVRALPADEIALSWDTTAISHGSTPHILRWESGEIDGQNALVHHLQDVLNELGAEQRMKVMRAFCRSCGRHKSEWGGSFSCIWCDDS